jgi:hypothetical protein
MGLEMLSGVLASAAIHWVVNGLPIEATYVTAPQLGCDVAAARAATWRRSGRHVTEKRVGEWCVVGSVIDGYWVSEQWHVASTSTSRASGWRIRTPLSGSRVSGSSRHTEWSIDVVDPAIFTRVKFRSSRDRLDVHHDKTIAALTGGNAFVRDQEDPMRSGRPLRMSRLHTGDLVLSGATNGLRYSVVIQRLEKR